MVIINESGLYSFWKGVLERNIPFVIMKLKVNFQKNRGEAYGNKDR